MPYNNSSNNRYSGKGNQKSVIILARMVVSICTHLLSPIDNVALFSWFFFFLFNKRNWVSNCTIRPLSFTDLGKSIRCFFYGSYFFFFFKCPCLVRFSNGVAVLLAPFKWPAVFYTMCLFFFISNPPCLNMKLCQLFFVSSHSDSFPS